MKHKLFRFAAGHLTVLLVAAGWSQNPKHCADQGPPSIWVVKSPYPFQAGAEAAFDELYHGPWKTTVDFPIYAAPRSTRLSGTIKQGTVVDALLGETIVVHPLRLVAKADYQMETENKDGTPQFATMHQGDVFWVLDSANEGMYSVWWNCKNVGWDSTEKYIDDPKLDLLGSNEERWIKLRNPKTGLSGWIQEKNDGKIVPAVPTTKRTG
jgi:hypothetical protein